MIGLFVLIRGDVKDRQKRWAKANRISAPTATIDDEGTIAAPKESGTTETRTTTK